MMCKACHDKIRRIIEAIGPSVAFPQRNSFRRLQLAVIGRRQRLGEQHVEQAAAGGGGGGEARLQPVAERHQCIDLGDDAMLFSERWESQRQIATNLVM